MRSPLLCDRIRVVICILFYVEEISLANRQYQARNRYVSVGVTTCYRNHTIA